MPRLRRELQFGLDELERGDYREYTSVNQLFDDIQTEVAKRAAKKPRAR